MNGTQIAQTSKKIVDKSTKRVLKPKQLRLVRQTIQGLINTPSKTACAEELGISQQALWNRLNKYPEIAIGVKSFVESVKEDSRRRLDLTTPVAVDKVVSLMEAKSENVQLQASTEILDRAGIVKPQENNIQVNVLNNLNKDKEEFNL